MDCPGRERAGWLCDSFFTARVEKCLTNTSNIETNFLENFLLPNKYDYLPDGMFPMCYPADHMDGIYIPNWAMWLVIELEDYLARTGNLKMINDFKVKVYKLIDFFGTYENADGLIEKLEKWVFVEWSKANELTQDVSYPTNMLYSAMLSAAGKIYHDEELLQKAEAIKNTIRQKSFNGKFFTYLPAPKPRNSALHKGLRGF
jgi:alpha-L-rhamnosidase